MSFPLSPRPFYFLQNPQDSQEKFSSSLSPNPQVENPNNPIIMLNSPAHLPMSHSPCQANQEDHQVSGLL